MQLDDYPVDEIHDMYQQQDLEGGDAFSYDDIQTFLQWGDDQALHGGTSEELEAYDDEYNVFSIFPGIKQGEGDEAEYRRIVPGAQLFATTVASIDPVDEVVGATFEEPVYEDETVRYEVEDTGDTTTYTFVKETDEGQVDTGSIEVRHGDDGVNDTLATMVPIGMGQWDRRGDVLLGYQDVETDATLDEMDGADFHRELDGEPDDSPGKAVHSRGFVQDGEPVLTYDEINLHLEPADQ